MRKLFGLLGLGLFAAAILMGGSLAAFLNVPSAILVLGGTTFFSLAHHGPGPIRSAFSASVRTEPLGAGEAGRQIAVLQTVRVLAVGMGLTGSLIGLVQMLRNMEDPAHIGPAMAVALLCSLYGVALSEFAIAPRINRIAARVEAPPAVNPTPTAKPSGVALVTLPFVLSAFFVMLIAMIG